MTGLVAWAAALTPHTFAADAADLSVPEGFRISLYAEGVPDARAMALGARGTVFAGSRQAGAVYAITDGDGDALAERVRKVDAGLDLPTGVAFRDGDLYVAEVGRILRYPRIEERLDRPPRAEIVRDDFPRDPHHGWKFIAFGPDAMLYVPVGAPCNVCRVDEGPYGKLYRMKPDGSAREVFARGIRNTVGFDWDPRTKELWFTDNGRDRLGDDRPPDELNHAPRAGLHFGFPDCHGGDLPDPDLRDGKGCASFAAPAKKLGPHVAAIGMRFYTGSMFPERYRNRIFIAEHGSWDRSEPIGYRITTVAVEDGKAGPYEVFAEGWLRDGRPWGRPADVLVMPDGALLVSDDLGGVIWRISTEPGR